MDLAENRHLAAQLREAECAAVDARQRACAGLLHTGRMRELMSMQARTFVAYAPRGAGLVCAMLYVPIGHEVYGWYLGGRDGVLESAYFRLEEFYTPFETRLVTVPDAELHTGRLGEDALCHELARLQEAFRGEWLWDRADAVAPDELARYHDAELALGEVNVRFARLAKFSKLQPTWTYYSEGFERSVLRALAKRWPLDFRREDAA